MKNHSFGKNTSETAEILKTFESKAETVNIAELIENGAVMNDSLMLVNGDYPLPEDYEPSLIGLNGNEVFMNSFTADGYYAVKTAVKEKFDNSLYIMSAFRTAEEQASAIESEGENAAEVGSSEHQTGLALDVYVMYHAGMGFLASEEGKFVNSYCQDYGFIIRYPYYGESITGISYEPWHLRYVGLPHSKIIAGNQITLEEYIFSFSPGEIYTYDDYLITRQDPNESFSLPADVYDIIISPDNTGYFIITGKYK